MDLHELCKIAGEEEVATVIGCAVGSLRNKRSGQRPLSIDDLYRLWVFYGSAFDAPATVKKIGRRRAARVGLGGAVSGVEAPEK